MGLPVGESDRKDRPTAIDLFCGCGGASLGLRAAGFDVIGAVDVDHLALKTYEANHPKVKTWPEDVRRLTVKSVMRELGIKRGQLGVLAGCPPCQGFSTMRTLNGSLVVEDERNDLVLAMLRFVRVLRPKAVMMENVPRLAKDRRFRQFYATLKKLGYDVNWAVLNARHYGVPQRRRRLLLLAGYGKSIDFAPQDDTRVTVRDAIGDLPPAGHSGDPPHDLGEHRSERIRDLIAKIPRDGGSRTDLPDSDQLPCHMKCDGFKDVYGRMAWDDVAPTITGGCFNPSKGRFLHPEKDRAITMREAALLQSFPRTYSFPDCNSKCALALLIGNALPPEFIRRHALKIHACLRHEACAEDNPAKGGIREGHA
ncbi:MAG: DNA cytosine methyltransferase [bacterium]